MNPSAATGRLLILLSRLRRQQLLRPASMCRWRRMAKRCSATASASDSENHKGRDGDAANRASSLRLHFHGLDLRRSVARPTERSSNNADDPASSFLRTISSLENCDGENLVAPKLRWVEPLGSTRFSSVLSHWGFFTAANCSALYTRGFGFAKP